jgi:hypothetical protein
MRMYDTGPSLSLCIDAAVNDVGGVVLKLKPSSKEACERFSTRDSQRVARSMGCLPSRRLQTALH